MVTHGYSYVGLWSCKKVWLVYIVYNTQELSRSSMELKCILARPAVHGADSETPRVM